MEFFARPEMFKFAGLAGVIIGLIGVIVPSLVYRGTKGEKYSFLNHYISELGETGVSRLAWVFNLGMILSGVCIIVASLSLGLVLPGFWAKAGLVLGVASGAALSLVGVFPMNKMERHFKAAVPGVILRVNVSEGDVVAEGDELVVLDVMKMETPVVSPCDGMVKAVLVAQTDKVNTGDVLVVVG